MRITLVITLLCFAACNSVLGVSDVELATDAGGAPPKIPDANSSPPDAGPDRSACKIEAHVSRIALDSSTPTASLSRDDDGSPSMFVVPTSSEGLLIGLHDNMGGHGALDVFGSFQLTAADSDVGECGICVLFGAGYDTNTKSFSQYYVPRMKGQLQISTATATELVGSMQGLELRHVNLDTSTGTTTDNSDHCTVTVDEIDFNLTYSAAALEHRGLRALLKR